MAPNLVTLSGFFFVLISFFATIYHSPDLQTPLPPQVSLVNLVCIFLYQTFDALDGKQARRTSSSSPLGELFDHGCDAMTSVLSGITLYASVGLGCGWAAFYQNLFLMLAFYFTQWEVYFTGCMVLGEVSVTEAQFLGMLIHFVSYYWGSSFWFTRDIEFTVPYFNIPVTCSRGEALFPFTMLTYVATIGGAAYNVFINVDHKKNKQLPYIFPAIFVSLFAAVWVRTTPGLQENHGIALYTTVGFLFAIVISKLTTARVCKLDWNTNEKLLWPLLFCVFNSLLAEPLVEPVTLLHIYTAVSVLGYLHFAICVIHDMTHYLGIHALFID